MSQDAAFEAEVRRIASLLFPGSGNPNPTIIAERERDGVFISDDIIHIIEATTSRRKEKAMQDLNKSAELVKTLRKQYPYHNFKIWFVTQNDPTADQSDLAGTFRSKAKCPVQVLSLSAFSSKLVDSREYITKRNHYPFGSIRDLHDMEQADVSQNQYIEQLFYDIRGNQTRSLDDLFEIILKESRVLIITGDFGSGKSMSLRQLHLKLAAEHLEGRSQRFPIYLNLRDHFGQEDPAEALVRHGTRLGMANPSQLVAAWRAGYAVLLLDGFDELASGRFVRGAPQLKQARRAAMRLVRAFLQPPMPNVSVVVAGRLHYFDDYDEMEAAFGVMKPLVVEIREFDENQIRRFLQAHGVAYSIPDWLPSRPLLLGILTVRRVLSPATRDWSSLAPEAGWDLLLDAICRREAEQIDPTVMQPEAVREFVERLATKARKNLSGRGPLSLAELRDVFTAVFGSEPDETAEIFLYRFAGLTSASDPNSREFIDDQLVDACRAGDLVRFVNSPYDSFTEDLQQALFQTEELGVRLVAKKLSNASDKKVSNALRLANRDGTTGVVCVDLIHVLEELGKEYVDDPMTIKDGSFQYVMLGRNGRGLSRITFLECIINKLDIDVSIQDPPTFRRCVIDMVMGPASEGELARIVKWEASSLEKLVDEAQTNADVMELDIPLGVRVLITILRKLFIQRGSGRRESAFYRGLSPRAAQYVRDLLEIVERRGFAHPLKMGGPTVWIPNRARAADARDVISHPNESVVDLVVDARKL